METKRKEAKSLISQGNYQDALTRLNKCIEVVPNWDAPHRYRAWIFAIHNFELDDALKSINKCLNLLSSDSNVSTDSFAISYDVLGEVYLRRNDFANAIAAFNNCLKLKAQTTADDSNYSTVYRLGICYLAVQDFPSAHSFLLKAVALNADNPAVYSAMGDACLAVASYASATEYYGKTIALTPKWDFNYPITGRPDNNEGRRWFLYVCMVNKSVAYSKMEDDDNCLKCNEEAYAIYPNDATAPINIAELYAKKGNKEKVRKFLEAGIPLINPEHNKNLMSTLLHFDFVEYRDLVLLLLRKQNKISQDEYDQHLQYLKKLQEKKASGAKSDEQAYHINVTGNVGRLTMGNESNRNMTVGNIGNYAEGNTNIHGPSVGIAQGPVDFGSTQNVPDFVRELQKLKEEIVKAKNTNSLDEEVAAKIEKHVNDAITQSSSPKPDKGKIVNSLGSATNIAESVKKFMEVAKPIADFLIVAGKAAVRLFG